MIEPLSQGNGPWQEGNNNLSPNTLPHRVSVRNTFLEFQEETLNDEDPWLLMPGRAPRLQTDSVVERASLRLSLEQNIRVVLDAQRLSALSKNEKAAPQPGTGGSSPAQKPVGTGATLDGTWASEASSSLPATWTSEAEEEAAEYAEGVVQDFAPR